MANLITTTVECLLIVSALGIAAAWWLDPAGNYEPILAICGGLTLAFDILRRYLRSLKLRVFLSVGATYTKQQEDCVLGFERMLVEYDFERLVVGRDNPPAKQPLLEVKELMLKSDAVVVLAFTRYVIIKGVEKPKANLPYHEESTIKEKRFPTVWNQIEAGIAFGLNKPLLVLVEHGLEQEAMIKKDRLEFMARIIDLDPKQFETQDFRKAFVKFAKEARRRSWSRL